MIPIETLLTLALATAIASAVPGPTVAVVAANGVRRGARARLALIGGGLWLALQKRA